MLPYTSRDDMPLVFHNFFRFIGLPVNMFTLITAIMVEPLGGSYFAGYHLASFIFTAVCVVLNAFIFIGFFRWKPYALYLIMARSAVGIVSSLFVIIRHASYHNTESFIIIVERAGMILTFCYLTYYYLKRKPLFFSTAPGKDTPSSNGN